MFLHEVSAFRCLISNGLTMKVLIFTEFVNNNKIMN